MRRIFFGTAVWLASLAIVAPRTVGAADDQRYLDGLRARGLFELAEKYCVDRLADPQITDARRADLTIELSRTLTRHALEVAPPEAPPLWQRVDDVVSGFAARHPRHPKLILVRVQGALAAALEGEAAREAIEGSPDSPAAEAARGVLRGAIAKLRKLADEVAAQLRRRGRRPAAADELSTAQLQSLDVSIRYELARALRNQSLSYKPGTADQINALSQALESLTGLPLAKPRGRLDWSAALEEIACLRLLGEYPRAQRKLLGLEKVDPPGEFAGRLRAERIRLALARRQIDEALSEAGASGGRHPSGPEAEMARLEALLAAWRRASGQRNHAQATDWQRRAVEQVRAIGRSYGSRPMRKAETLLARAMADSQGPRSAELLAQAAASYYRSGQIGRALAAYDQASERAREMRQPRQAFQSAFTAATIEKERKHYRDALARYRTLADSPEQPKAAEAHLLAVYCAAQLAQAEQPPKLDQYEQLLREHIARWPDDPTSAQARLWLARLALHQGNWSDAVETLRPMKPGDAQFAEAVETMGRAYEAWFEDLHQRDERAGQLPDEALEWFERARPRRGGKPSAATRAAALTSAGIWLREVPTGALPAERLLREALDHDADAPASWQASARRLLVPALAAQGKRAQADAVAEQIPRATASDALALLRVLWAVRRRASADVKHELADLELAAEDELLGRGQQLDAATRRAVTRERAVALAILGRRDEARAALQKLAAAAGRDGQTQEELARLLSSGEEPDLAAALAQWSEVAVRSRPGTPRWYRANYALARTQLEFGQVAAARATVARVSSRYPDFGGTGRKRKFDQLSNEIAQPPRRGR